MGDSFDFNCFSFHNPISSDELEFDVPRKPLQISFVGCPPKITKIDPESPLKKYGVTEGMDVDTLQINGTTYYEMDSVELRAHLLKYQLNAKCRIRLITSKIPLSQPPIPKQIILKETPDTMDIELPTGQMGVWFSGHTPVLVKSVQEDSVLAGQLPEGMGVTSLTIGKRVYKDIDDVNELASLLNNTSGEMDRVLHVIKPELYDDDLETYTSCSTSSSLNSLEDANDTEESFTWRFSSKHTQNLQSCTINRSSFQKAMYNPFFCSGDESF